MPAIPPHSSALYQRLSGSNRALSTAAHHATSSATALPSAHRPPSTMRASIARPYPSRTPSPLCRAASASALDGIKTPAGNIAARPANHHRLIFRLAMDMAYLPVSPGGTPHFGADRRLAYPSAPGPRVPCSPGHGLTCTCRRELLALKRRATQTAFAEPGAALPEFNIRLLSRCPGHHLPPPARKGRRAR